MEEPEQGEQRQRRQARLGLLREEAEADADQAEDPGLKEQPGEIDRAGDRRLGVGVRQPGVEGDERNLDGKGGEESKIEPPSLRRAQGVPASSARAKV
jgi:hypothetical protein